MQPPFSCLSSSCFEDISKLLSDDQGERMMQITDEDNLFHTRNNFVSLFLHIL